MLRLISGFKDLEVWETRECALRLKSEGRALDPSKKQLFPSDNLLNKSPPQNQTLMFIFHFDKMKKRRHMLSQKESYSKEGCQLTALAADCSDFSLSSLQRQALHSWQQPHLQQLGQQHPSLYLTSSS